MRDHAPETIKKLCPKIADSAGLTDYENENSASWRLMRKIIEEIISHEDSINIEEANILVSAGRGVGTKENLHFIEELAEAVGGTVSGSRPLVDLGWLPHPQQVGQSGKTVAPTLYFALGISGAVQHLVGMTSSDIVVAINKDKEAPIFEVADFGIVGDMFEIIQEFVKLVEEEKAKETA